jgi:hypothetical protein
MTASTNPCQAFFEQHAQTEYKAAELVKTGQSIQWEALTASRHSPGPVANHEHVLRLVVNPIHVDAADGSLKPTLMSDVKKKGGSVHRLVHVSQEAVIEAGRTHAAAKNAANPGAAQPRSIYGTVRLSVQEVRSLVVATNDRAFGVFDTAKQVEPSHADIFMIVPDSGQEARSARLQLMDLANKGFQPA